MSGIKRLEYRGYDSAGIAFLKDDDYQENNDNIQTYSSGIVTIKEKGQIAKLEKIVGNQKVSSSIAIAHTRWATHGKPSIENSHPHMSPNGKWAVVHNGIIENYLDLKKIVKNDVFKSQTDTEIIAHLLEKYHKTTPLETIKYVCSLLKGSYALAIIFSEHPDSIFVAKNNSPVIVGTGQNAGIICSDLNGLNDAKFAYNLDNGDFALVKKGNVKIYDNDLKEKDAKNIFQNDTQVKSGKGHYKYYMQKEIDEIPNAISRTVKMYDSFQKIRKSLPIKAVKNIKNILIIACGTAYHAGLMGKKLFEEEGYFCNCEVASEFRYSSFLYPKNTLAIFVSQSGETADTIKALELCKQHGLKTLSITNVKNSSITYESDYCLYTQAGAEIAVASTKAYNSQVAIFHLLSAYLKSIKFKQDFVKSEGTQLVKLTAIITKNKIKHTAKKISKQIKSAQSLYMIGRGIDYNLALESSLKLKEISYIHSEAYPAGELKHGTISLIDKNTFVFAFVTQESIKDKTLSNISEVSSREGKVIVLSQFDFDKKGIFKVVKLPNINQRYIPLVAITYMQQIAYFTSVSLGNNPDKPRSLAKSVTVE